MSRKVLLDAGPLVAGSRHVVVPDPLEVAGLRRLIEERRDNRIVDPTPRKVREDARREREDR